MCLTIGYTVIMERGIQTQIARRVGVTSQFICQIISGKKRPSWQIAKKIAKATLTSPVLWLEGTPDDIRAALSKTSTGANAKG